MGLSLAQTQAVSQLAKHLYDYLPGSSGWKGTYTFAHAARAAGVSEYWAGGSKLPALTSLLECTLAARPSSFCRLIEEIVRAGISYRSRKGRPLTQADLATLNELVSQVGFGSPKLRDPAFIASLPRAPSPSPSPAAVQPDSAEEAQSERRAFSARLAGFRRTFLALQSEADRNAAGLSLERVLNGLFHLYDLEPNEAFRVVGEQIDGSFLLDSEVYLLEAKWTAGLLPEADLLIFRGKVEGKSSFTRGLFVSINGFSQMATHAIATGKQPTFIMMDGADLYRVLEGSVRLDDLLRRKVRWLAERGHAYATIAELFGPGTR